MSKVLLCLALCAGVAVIAANGLAQDTGCPDYAISGEGPQAYQRCKPTEEPHTCQTQLPSSCTDDSDCCMWVPFQSVGMRCQYTGKESDTCHVAHFVCAHKLQKSCQLGECVGTGTDGGPVYSTTCS